MDPPRTRRKPLLVLRRSIFGGNAVNLRQLQYFRAIAELEHYTRAAEKLYVSQSNLSHSIQELESELNVEFFVRKGRNIKLTKYGELFLPYVEKALDTLDLGVAKLQDFINPNSGTVVIAGFPSVAQFVPDIIVRYVSETGRVGVRLQFNQEDTYFGLRDQLLAGTVDLVFATHIDDSRVGAAAIGEHQVALLVPKGHRLARLDSIDLRELDGEDFVAFDNNCQLRADTDKIFAELGISPRITMETAQDIIIYGLVAAKHGVAITPRPLGAPPYGVKILPIANEMPPRELYIMWNKEQYTPPAAEYFRDFVVRSGAVFNDFFERSEHRHVGS